jgi:hypothetical protein
MYSPHRDISFGDTHVPAAVLPLAFQACVNSSARGESSAECDSTVGSKVTGLGYCSQKAYKNTIYCGCVNSGVSSPECVFAPCADTPHAYKTTAMQTTLKDPTRPCPSSVNCASVRAMGGEKNVASNVRQPKQCYGLGSWIMEHFNTIVVLLVLVAVIATFVECHYMPGKRRRASEAYQKNVAEKQPRASP